MGPKISKVEAAILAAVTLGAGAFIKSELPNNQSANSVDPVYAPFKDLSLLRGTGAHFEAQGNFIHRESTPSGPDLVDARYDFYSRFGKVGPYTVVLVGQSRGAEQPKSSFGTVSGVFLDGGIIASKIDFSHGTADTL